MNAISDEIIQRFMSKVTITDDCWLWNGAKNHAGYGRFSLNNRNWLAHRASFLIFRCDLPNDKHLMHLCDNPPCINPFHLELATPADNMQDKTVKGRGRNGAEIVRGERHPQAKLTVDHVKNIRSRYAGGGITHLELAREFSVDRSLIGMIVRMEIWK